MFHALGFPIEILRIPPVPFSSVAINANLISLKVDSNGTVQNISSYLCSDLTCVKTVFK